MAPEINTMYRYWLKWRNRKDVKVNEILKLLSKDLLNERELNMATKKAKTTATTTTTTETKNDTPDEKCVWHIGTPCSENNTSWKEMFNHQIRIPICGDHFDQHLEIMLLHKNGYDVEEILNATPEWRKQEVLTLKLSGLETGEVEP